MILKNSPSDKAKQTKRILHYMLDNGSITQLEAMNLSVMRLASRIHDLRKMGVEIQSETVKGVNKYGEPFHCCRYVLGG